MYKYIHQDYFLPNITKQQREIMRYHSRESFSKISSFDSARAMIPYTNNDSANSRPLPQSSTENGHVSWRCGTGHISLESRCSEARSHGYGAPVCGLGWHHDLVPKSSSKHDQARISGASDPG